MTRQEMFDRVWQHFVVEKGPPSGDVNRCNYRDPSGAKCALGLLIPDALYDPKMESLGTDALLRCYPAIRALLAEGFDGTPAQLGEFSYRLQRCHDDAVSEAVCEDAAGTFHSLIAKRLTDLAGSYVLTIPS